jgi:uncharacterized protein
MSDHEDAPPGPLIDVAVPVAGAQPPPRAEPGVRVDSLLGRLLGFVDALRENGVRVAQQESLDAMAALSLLGGEGLEAREALAAALRATLIKRSDDDEVFERVFRLHFGLPAPGDRGLEQALEAALQARGLDPNKAAALAARARAEAQGELAEALLAGDYGSLAALVRAALDDTQTEGLRTPLQLGYFTHRLLTRLGVDELEGACQRATGGAGSAAEQRALGGALDERLLGLRRLAQQVMRAEYDKRHGRADRTSGRLEDRPFSRLDDADMARMRALVLRLAERLKAKAKRREQRRRRGRLDVRRTVRASLATDGVPLGVELTRRRKDRPEVVVLCDVSDSVRSASLFMLQLVYSLSELFRGVRSFVFVDHLVEVTKLFGEDSRSDAVAAVQRGEVISVHSNSDYGRSLREYAALHLDSVTRRSTVLILGDGRTNYRPDEAWVVFELRRRAKAVLWLCPEPRGTWGFGDSRMPQYDLACTSTFEVSTLAQLAKAIDRLAL